MPSRFQARAKASWRRRLLYSPPALILLVAVIVFLARSVWATYQRSREAAASRQEAAEELAKWLGRQDELAAEVAFLSTERGQEELIREKFSVAREGEGVIAVLPTPAATSTPPAPKPWWRRVFDWLASVV